MDIIISEWMGYALLYESMLDSVLVARDRFLRPGGVMAPSQCKMMLGLTDAKEIYKERISFWNDIYGKAKFSALNTTHFILHIQGSIFPRWPLTFMMMPLWTLWEKKVSLPMSSQLKYGPASPSLPPYSPMIIQDIPIGTLTPQSLNFSSPFALTATRRVLKAHAFILYFDTFFSPSGVPVPEDTAVHLVKEGEPALAEVWQVPGKSKRKESSGDKGKEVSFSTGPLSAPTHWKHTLFLLREPIKAEEGE